MYRFKLNNGFTMIELLIGLAVLIILLGLANPVIGRFIESSQESVDTINDYYDDVEDLFADKDGINEVFILSGGLGNKLVVLLNNEEVYITEPMKYSNETVGIEKIEQLDSIFNMSETGNEIFFFGEQNYTISKTDIYDNNYNLTEIDNNIKDVDSSGNLLFKDNSIKINSENPNMVDPTDSPLLYQGLLPINQMREGPPPGDIEIQDPPGGIGGGPEGSELFVNEIKSNDINVSNGTDNFDLLNYLNINNIPINNFAIILVNTRGGNLLGITREEDIIPAPIFKIYINVENPEEIRNHYENLDIMTGDPGVIFSLNNFSADFVFSRNMDGSYSCKNFSSNNNDEKVTGIEEIYKKDFIMNKNKQILNEKLNPLIKDNGQKLLKSDIKQTNLGLDVILLQNGDLYEIFETSNGKEIMKISDNINIDFVEGYEGTNKFYTIEEGLLYYYYDHFGDIEINNRYELNNFNTILQNNSLKVEEILHATMDIDPDNDFSEPMQNYFFKGLTGADADLPQMFFLLINNKWYVSDQDTLENSTTLEEFTSNSLTYSKSDILIFRNSIKTLSDDSKVFPVIIKDNKNIYHYIMIGHVVLMSI